MRLKFVSLNVWIGGVLFDDIVSFLQGEDADVIVLQEVLEGNDLKLPVQYHTLTSLQAHLNYPYQDFAPSCIDRFPWGDIPMGNAVLSRLPIVAREELFFHGKFDPSNPRLPFAPDSWPVTPRSLQHATLDSPAGDIHTFNLQGVWDLNGDEVSPQRQKMSDTIRSAIKDKPRVILAGDTNATPANAVMRAIEQDLMSVFGNSLTTTFNMRRKSNPGYATAAVDMMYVSRDIRVLKAQCPDIDISDHLPLVATFEIVDKNKET